MNQLENHKTNNQLIKLKQLPIIEFSAMEARAEEVAKDIKTMNIPAIEATEENRALMKKMRASLNKDLNVFESQRKMIKGKINQSYNEFNISYESNIKTLYDKACNDLKIKISEVEEEMLNVKKADIKAYFDKKNTHSFVSVEQVKLNIILSATDKSLKASVDDFIDCLDIDIKAIESMENSVRIKGYYERTLDLSDSISTVNADIKREEQLDKERIAKERADKERAEKEVKEKLELEERQAKERAEQAKRDKDLAEERRVQAEKNAKTIKTKETQDAKDRADIEAKEAKERANETEQNQERLKQERFNREALEAASRKIHTARFEVKGTMEQLKKLKEFMLENNIKFEAK